MRPSRLVGALAGLCVLLPSPVAGQAPAERHAIASLIDTLGALTDTVSLRRREAALDRTAKARDSALARVRPGTGSPQARAARGIPRCKVGRAGASPGDGATAAVALRLVCAWTGRSATRRLGAVRPARARQPGGRGQPGALGRAPAAGARVRSDIRSRRHRVGRADAGVARYVADATRGDRTPQGRGGA